MHPSTTTTILLAALPFLASALPTPNTNPGRPQMVNPSPLCQVNATLPVSIPGWCYLYPPVAPPPSTKMSEDDKASIDAIPRPDFDLTPPTTTTPSTPMHPNVAVDSLPPNSDLSPTKKTLTGILPLPSWIHPFHPHTTPLPPTELTLQPRIEDPFPHSKHPPDRMDEDVAKLPYIKKEPQCELDSGHLRRWCEVTHPLGVVEKKLKCFEGIGAVPEECVVYPEGWEKVRNGG